MDFTPNYICDADAMQRLHAGAVGQRGRLRFIIVMRDPIMRAFSEWAMFSLGWNWDAVKNFSASMSYKLRALKDCNATLYMRPHLLRSLPTAEIATYMRRCFNYGAATMYPTTSMYSVCMLHALRYFRREQFLVLRYEELMKMDADTILSKLSNFTGLHLSARMRSTPKCQPTRTRRGKARGRGQGGQKLKAPATKGPNSYSSNSPYAAEMLQEASGPLEVFFAPYNRLLRQLIGPSFEWSARDHRKTPLSAEQKTAALSGIAKYREALRQRQVSKRIAERLKANSVRAAHGDAGAGRRKGQRLGSRAAARGRGLARRPLPPQRAQKKPVPRGARARAQGRGRARGAARGHMAAGALSSP